MLNVLFVYSSLVTDVVDGKYYNNALNSFIKRYKPLGNLTVCVSRKECDSSSQSLVDFKDVRARFVEKENTIKKRFIDRSRNKNIISELVKQSDLVIGHVPDSVATIALEYALRLRKTCMAVAVGCPWDAFWNHSLRGKCMAPIGFFTMRRIMGKVPYAMYVTEKFLQRRYPCKGETVACSNVELRLSEESILDKRLTKINDIKKGTLKIVTSAAVNVRYKRQQDVIKAMSLLLKQDCDIQYYLLGGGDNTYLCSIAEKCGVAENVHFLGLCSHEEVFNILDDMDVYVQPSRTEGLPRALVEAMSRGLPAIGTDVGGIPELLQSDCLYSPGDIKTLAQIISGFTVDKMRECAFNNFKRAQDFQKNVLDKRRTTFMRHIKAMAESVQK